MGALSHLTVQVAAHSSESKTMPYVGASQQPKSALETSCSVDSPQLNAIKELCNLFRTKTRLWTFQRAPQKQHKITHSQSYPGLANTSTALDKSKTSLAQKSRLCRCLRISKNRLETTAASKKRATNSYRFSDPMLWLPDVNSLLERRPFKKQADPLLSGDKKADCVKPDSVRMTKSSLRRTPLDEKHTRSEGDSPAIFCCGSDELKMPTMAHSQINLGFEHSNSSDGASDHHSSSQKAHLPTETDFFSELLKLNKRSNAVLVPPNHNPFCNQK